MKLRIRGNSLRFRVDAGDLMALRDSGHLEAAVSCVTGQGEREILLTYAVCVQSEAETPALQCECGRFEFVIGERDLAVLANGGTIQWYEPAVAATGECQPLSVALEVELPPRRKQVS